MRVVVLGGGTSEEREVSLATADAVAGALASLGWSVERAEVLPAGGWAWEGESVDFGALARRLDAVDACFLALHGGTGEDGTVQGMLEVLGVAYTGSGVAASALCMDKVQMRRVAAACGLEVASARLVPRGQRADPDAILSGLGPRVVAKPRHGGSSVGVVVTEAPEELAAAVHRAHEAGDDALVEAWAEGVEVTCGVLGGGGDAEALPLVEIRPKPGRFFDYEEKYSETGAEELCPPVGVAPEDARAVQALALRAHRELGCRGYSRSDFVLRRGEPPLFLETNTLPGLTPRSLLPQEAAASGRDFPRLCREIVELALEAHASGRSGAVSRPRLPAARGPE